MYSVCVMACEVLACSVLTDIDAPRGRVPIQPSTARLGHQIRYGAYVLRHVNSQHGWKLNRILPRPLNSSRCYVVPETRDLKVLSRDGTTPSLPHIAYILLFSFLGLKKNCEFAGGAEVG